jgi:hypothetical protein
MDAMRFPVVVLLLWAALAAAQTPPPANKASATPKSAAVKVRSECAVAVSLCVSVPASWQRLGDIFGDLGFVVAEPHPGVDSASWPQLSVAALDVPAQKSGEPQSLDALVELVLTPDGTFTSSETLQRSRLLLNGSDAEILRVKLHDEATKADYIEEVALIQGEPGMVYSIALRCAAEDATRFDPVFQRAIHSWRIKPAPPSSGTPSKSRQDSEKK